MPTSDWGNPTWTTAHWLAHAFPEAPTPEQKTAMVSFCDALAVLLPCGTCGHEFQNMCQNDPPAHHVGSGSEIRKWWVNVHNRVNHRLGKPPMSEDQVLELYNRGGPWAVLRDECRGWKHVAMIASALLALTMGLVVYLLRL